MNTGWMPRYSAKATADSGVAHAVDVGQRQAGVLEGVEDHRHLERAPAAVELSGGGHVVGDAHDRGGPSQSPVRPFHPDDPPVPTRSVRRAG